MAYRWLHRSAILLAGAAFLAVFSGTAVTSNEERPFYSLGQNHLWLGPVVAALTITVGIWLRVADERLWLRRLGLTAITAVVIQLWLGLQPLPQAPAVRIAHASMAQLLFPATVVMAICTSVAWRRPPKRIEGSRILRLLARMTPVAVLLQVALGTLFRHGVLGVGPHLIGAFVVVFFILGLALGVLHGPEHPALHLAARTFLTIAAAQVFLGLALFSLEVMDVDPTITILMTMIHAATGALTLTATVVMAVLIGRWIYVPNRP